MIKTLIPKMLTFLVFLLALSVIVFWLARLAPGDPLTAYYGEAVERMNESQRTMAMERLSLNQPIGAQYLTWLTSALTGNWGISHQYKQRVDVLIGKLWVNTLLLGGISYLLTFALAILLGVFCAAKEGGMADRILCRAGTVASVIPTFFVALIAILIFGVNLKIFPTSGAYSIGGGGFFDRMTHLILPVAVMVLSHLWYYAYMIRNRMIEELRKDYVLLLQVKRISEVRILLCHCLRNAMPMLITVMALSVSHIVGGTYVVEKVFGYPGLGTLIFESAQYRDYNMLSALTLLTGILILTANMAGQALTEFLDPRMRQEEQEWHEVGQGEEGNG